MIQTSCVLVMKKDFNVFKCSCYDDHVMKDYRIQKRLKKKKTNYKQRSQVVPVGNVEKVKLESKNLSMFSGVHRKERICLVSPNAGEEHVLS